MVRYDWLMKARCTRTLLVEGAILELFGKGTRIIEHRNVRSKKVTDPRHVNRLASFKRRAPSPSIQNDSTRGLRSFSHNLEALLMRTTIKEREKGVPEDE